MKEKRLSGISFVRVLAVSFILICHFLQAYDNGLRYFFNVGVQIFLLISGYLYGMRTIKSEEIILWYSNRMIRILIPYYFMLFVIVFVNLIIGTDIVVNQVISSIFCTQWYGISVPNAGHLWYISCILFCYFITPLLQEIIKGIRTVKSSLYFLIIVAFFLQIMELFGAINQTASMIFAYILGYVITSKDIYIKIKSNIYTILSGLIILGFMMFAIISCTTSIHISSFFLSWYKVAFAFAIVQLVQNNENIKEIGTEKIISYIDKYSYYIYLTHHIFILGALSLVKLTNILVINIIIILICICGSSVVLYKVSGGFSSLLRGK